MRARVLSSAPIGSCTALTPRGPQAMPQRPIAVSKIAKLHSVMAGSKLPHVVSLMPAGKIGLEIVAIHPNSGGILYRPMKRTEGAGSREKGGCLLYTSPE